MRTVARMLTPVGFVLGIGMGLLAVVVTQELQKVQSVAGAVAEERTAHDLVEHGAGKNAHLIVTGFHFGIPVVDKEHDGRTRWAVRVLPVEAAHKLRHEIMLQVETEKRTELDELLRQASLEVLASTSLPKNSILRKPVSSAAPTGTKLAPTTVTKIDAKAKAKVEPPKMIVLVPPRLAFFAGDALFDSIWPFVGWGVAGISFALAFGSLVWAWTIAPPPSRLDPQLKPRRDELRQALEFSTHHHPAWAYWMHTWQFFAAFALTVFGIIGGVAGCDQFLDQAAPASLVASAILTGSILMGAWGMIAWGFRQRWSSPPEVVAYEHGLRWRVGSHWDGIVWADVKSVQRGAVAVYQRGERVAQFGQVEVTLKDGRGLLFTLDRYTDYSVLANHVQTSAGESVVQEKGADFHNTGVADFGPVAVDPNGIVVKGGWFWFDRRIAWNKLEAYGVDNGHLILQRRDAWFFPRLSIPLATIPDYLPLLAILRTRGETAQTDPLRFALPPSR